MPLSSSSPSVITFGCRLNAYESQIMQNHAHAAGLENAIILNTCAVTAEAERQARQAIRKARRDNPEAYIVVTGCAAQLNPDTFTKMPEVDRVLGNEAKLEAASYSPHLTERVMVGDIMAVQEAVAHPATEFEGKARAFLEVQNGCDHRCTFCTIPLARGNSRSVPLGVLTARVRDLVQKGFAEVVFTGVDITAYGADLPGQPSLGKMVKRILALVPQLPRLRLSSIDPIEVDEDLFYVIANEPRLMPHLHISLQAGDDMILRRMKRRHLRQDAIDFCKKVRELRPDIVFGADLIAGFPTETDAMFKNTLETIEACGLTYLHVFPYSARPGTPAARMPQVVKTLIKERAAQLRQRGDEALKHTLETFIGRTVFVLMEKETLGRTEHFAPLHLAEPAPAGQIVQAQVTGVRHMALEGTLV